MNQLVAPAGRRRLGLLNDMQQGLSQPAPPRISIKAQRFTLVDAAGVQIPVQMFDNGEPGRQGVGIYLDVVIIGVNPNKSKIYYENEYDPTKDEAPTCFSDNGIGPSAQSSVPQSPTCAMCPNNVWGSAKSKMTGKDTKLCSDRKKLAVIVCNDPAQLVYQFQVPPASLKNLAVLAEQLGKHQTTDDEGVRATGPADVVTRIYFDPKKQGELLFQPMGYHEQMFPYIDPLIERAYDSGVIDLTTGKNDVPYSGAIALPNPGVQQALPAPAMQMQAPPPPPAQQPQMMGNPGLQGAARFQQPAQPQGGQPAAPAPRTRRGGARAGAGRPAQQEAPQQAPQPQAAPFVPMATGQMPVAQGNAFGSTSSQAAPQPAPFQPQAAQSFAGPVPAVQPSQMPDMPAFLQRSQNPAPFQPAAVAPGAPQGGPAFGMTNGAAPDPALSQALQSAFGQPMQPRQR